MEIWKNIKKRLKKPFEPKEEESHKIPSKWLKEKDRKGLVLKEPMVIIRREGRRKIRIPGLRIAKRIVAFVLGVFHFIVSQITLTSAPATQPLAIIFLITSFLLFDYVWKTRREKEIFNKVVRK